MVTVFSKVCSTGVIFITLFPYFTSGRQDIFVKLNKEVKATTMNLYKCQDQKFCAESTDVIHFAYSVIISECLSHIIVQDFLSSAKDTKCLH